MVLEMYKAIGLLYVNLIKFMYSENVQTICILAQE